MFRHKGKTRTFKHNLQIASLLSFIAGVVNVTGFLAVHRLTTNVTGHFAFFVDEVFKFNFWEAFIYFLYIFFFFLGSFVSNFVVEVVSRKNDRLVYVVPTLIESFILLSVSILGTFLISNSPNLLACSLLFAMGLQNSLVTKISNSVVRTTHLTGLFTDLGIELSQLFFFKQETEKKQLFSSIKLRLTIINFFFIGGIVGGILFSYIKLFALTIAGFTLIFGIVYDELKFRILIFKRKIRKSKEITQR